MSTFSDGYNYIKENAGAYVAATQGGDIATYVDSVEHEIQKLLNDINSFEGSAKGIEYLKGDVAEFWHADTFNIDAAVNKSAHHMNVPRSTELGSVDVESTFDQSEYSLKYYKSGEESAKAQAQSVRQGTHGRRGSTTDSLYVDQYRIIPSDQMAEAEEFLKRKIAEESVRRPDQVQRYQEALDLLRDRVKDNAGNESIPLSEEESRMLAQLAKDGGATEDVFGIEAAKREMMKQTAQDICKAGLTAATISLVLKTAPEVFSAIEQLIKDGQVDKGQFKTIGTSALTGGTEGFIRGSVSATIMACLKHQKIDANPAVVGAITVIAFDTMKNAYLVSTGEKTRQELAYELAKEIYVSTCALIAGGVVQGSLAILPAFGYMLGSFLGSTIG